MANEFERAVVICINRYVTEHRTKTGFAGSGMINASFLAYSSP
ncbi:MAG: hypothetical protein O0X93_02160 [Methanocorpusculum sp.]|nr:hypothetical protein [Methanocorpusculum sp.]